jgi:hypothetical protein
MASSVVVVLHQGCRVVVGERGGEGVRDAGGEEELGPVGELQVLAL